jgi:predicted DNA-binding transcriptional regulator AlpA
MPSSVRIRRSPRIDIAKPKARVTHVLPRQPVIDLNQPGRLRTAHVLALCGISHSTLYARKKVHAFPEPDGKDGGLNYWNTKTIRAYLEDSISNSCNSK